MVSYNDCDFIRELYTGYFITAVTRINNLAQRYEGGCEFPEVIITNYDPGERERSKPRQLDLLECGEMEKRIIMRSGKKSVRKERCYENRKQEKNNGAKKRENGVLSVPSELLTAGIPLDCDLMIETVPGVILIGIEAPVQTVCKPYLKVFDELGIEPNEVEALMGKEKRTR